jgi:transposase
LVETIRDHVAGAPVKHMDETGFRIGGKTQWLHVACTALPTFYRVCAKRGSLLSDIVGVVGVVVHDHWKPYYTMQGVLHALCNAHHLRELKALVEIEKEDWARKMQRLLRRACHAANLARERDAPLRPRLVECFERRYDAIVAEGLAFHEAQPPLAKKSAGKRRGRTPRRTGHNLLLRFETRKADTLRFLHDPAAPFTNNQAERDGRMMKLRQKISGGFRSLEGASDFATIRSFLNRQKTAVENPRRLDRRSRKSRENPAPCVILLKNLGSYHFASSSSADKLIRTLMAPTSPESVESHMDSGKNAAGKQSKPSHFDAAARGATAAPVFVTPEPGMSRRRLR